MVAARDIWTTGSNPSNFNLFNNPFCGSRLGNMNYRAGSVGELPRPVFHDFQHQELNRARALSNNSHVPLQGVEPVGQ